MSYTITHNGLDGQAGLYARIKRIYDGYWWSESGSAWVASASAVCDVALSEGSAGVYAASAGMTPMAGGLYAVYVYDASGNLVAMSEAIYQPSRKTALQIVNTVQRKLRLPQSTLITDAHAALMLEYANQIMLDFMMEKTTWDELKIKGAIGTRDGVSIYYVYPVNAANVDYIRILQVGTDDPIEKLTDEEFRDYARTVSGSEGQPLYYRIVGRAGSALIIELAPTPDAVYQVDFEVLQKPVRMTAAGDIPALDDDTIISGALFLARQEQGEDFQTELGAFQSKLGLHADNQSESNFQDVEPI